MAEKRLPESILPELRSKWVRYTAAREVVVSASQAMQRMEREYQETLNICLRVSGLDPGINHKVNLESGEISEVTPADLATSRDGGLPYVAPTVDSVN